MRVKAIIVAFRAALARRDVSNAGSARVLGNEGAEVDALGSMRRIPPRELAEDISADLIAATADRWPKMQAKLPRSEPAVRQRFDAALDDASCRSTPAGVQERDGAGGMRYENGYAVSNSDGEGKTALGSDVTISALDAEPPFPPVAVDDDARAVHLSRGREAGPLGRQLLAELTPSLHNDSRGLCGSQTKASRGAGGRERADTERREIVDALRVADDRHVCRRSSMRSIFAPSARSRSSMRS
jgi:hypothetical protein